MCQEAAQSTTQVAGAAATRQEKEKRRSTEVMPFNKDPGGSASSPGRRGSFFLVGLLLPVADGLGGFGRVY